MITDASTELYQMQFSGQLGGPFGNRGIAPAPERVGAQSDCDDGGLCEGERRVAKIGRNPLLSDSTARLDKCIDTSGPFFVNYFWPRATGAIPIR